MDYFIPFYPANNSENQSFWKNEETACRYYYLTHVYHKWKSYYIWFLRYGAGQTVFFSFWVIFCPFTQKMKILKKWKKTPGDIIISCKCTINDNHMIYNSRDMKCERKIFFLFWVIFCSFTPLTTKKIKILKKWRKPPGDINILHKCTKNHNHMLYYSWDMAHIRCNCYFSFWAIFCPFTTLTAQKIKI